MQRSRAVAASAKIMVKDTESGVEFPLGQKFWCVCAALRGGGSWGSVDWIKAFISVLFITCLASSSHHWCRHTSRSRPHPPVSAYACVSHVTRNSLMPVHVCVCVWLRREGAECHCLGATTRSKQILVIKAQASNC